VAGVFFFGTFEHAIDERGRVAIPARYRHAFVDGGVLRVGPEGAVEMYTQGSFEAEVARRLGVEDGNRSLDARRTRRSFLPEAYAVELDKQGRILVPPQIRERAAFDGRGDSRNDSRNDGGGDGQDDASTNGANGNDGSDGRSDGKVLIIGCGDYLELWHPDAWAGEQARLSDESAEGFA